MKIIDLKRIIDTQLENIPDFGNLEIKILVRDKDRTTGARPFATIINASFGFDHENGLLLAAKEPIQIIK